MASTWIGEHKGIDFAQNLMTTPSWLQATAAMEALRSECAASTLILMQLIGGGVQLKWEGGGVV